MFRTRAGLAALFAIVAVCGGVGSARADSTIAQLIAEGDAYDAKLDNVHALEAYLEAEKLGATGADTLYRIARQYALRMNDTTSESAQRDLAETALAYAKRAVAADPRNAKAQLSAAVCYGRLVPYVSSKQKVEYSRLIKEHADIALQLDPTDSYAWHILGVWNYELAKMGPFMRGVVKVVYGAIPPASNEEAVRLLRKAVEIAPERVSHHVELGRAYLALGMKNEARAELQRGLALPDREKDDPVSKQRAREALASL
ncbi:MAG TPA: tetratricopeptide repeat protein [Steroidobacteraceae bacterium]|nr:tetratricopeptide repeat protein [Steroidobacteraceae bacterium]